MKGESDNTHYGYLKDFPYLPNVSIHVIDKEKQRSHLWKQLFNPKEFCLKTERHEKIWKFLFWLGISFTLMAITVGLVKELDEEANEEETLNLSLAELILAIVSVIISFSKHCIKYNAIIEFQKNIQTNKHDLARKHMLSHRRKMYAMLIFLLSIFIIIIVVGFISLHYRNHSTSTDLIYTKYTTTLTLFLVLVLDGVINDVVKDARVKAEADQYKLLICQLNLELKAYLIKHGFESRAVELQAFLDSSELYRLNKDHLTYHRHIEMNDFTMKDDHNDDNFGNGKKSDIGKEKLFIQKTNC